MPDWIVEWVVGLTTLTAMEVVLGIDNIIFLAIIAGRLPPEQQPRARRIGLLVALGTRLLLLFGITLLLAATQPLFHLPGWMFGADEPRAISLKDTILIVGGLFLIGKSTFEIHHKLEGDEPHQDGTGGAAAASFAMVLAQIAMIDVVFSLDSVITAVGMVPNNISVIVVAMFITVGVMLIFAEPVSNFVARHPTLKILALSFLILIGFLLVTEGLHEELPRGYVYFAMAFSFVVEMLNLKVRRQAAPVHLHERHLPHREPAPERPEA